MLAVVVVACGSDDGNKEKNDNNENNNVVNENENNENDNANAGTENDGKGEVAEGESAFEDFLIYLEQMGFEMGEPEPKEASAGFGEEEGIIVTVDEIEAQFFYFDPEGENFDEKLYEEGKTEGAITIDVGGEEFAIPMFVHGDFGLANPDDHYKGEELMEAMSNY